MYNTILIVLHGVNLYREIANLFIRNRELIFITQGKGEISMSTAIRSSQHNHGAHKKTITLADVKKSKAAKK